MSSNRLQTIVESVQKKLEMRERKLSFKDLQVQAKTTPKPARFISAFQTERTHVIAEIKFRSPALGQLAAGSEAEAVEMAGRYIKAGATAISVLTEEDHFQGNYAYLAAIRRAHPEAPLLMKDFVLNEYQILEARLHGANAILLIVALLGAKKTRRLLNFADQMDLSTLIEVHDEAEFKIARELSPALIGVNNRNLKDLKISLETSAELAELIPDEMLVISESGIQTREEILRLEALGYRGFLIGTRLMQSESPEGALVELMGRAP